MEQITLHLCALKQNSQVKQTDNLCSDSTSLHHIWEAIEQYCHPVVLVQQIHLSVLLDSMWFSTQIKYILWSPHLF